MSDKKRILSNESLPLEINSRKKISLFEYKELIIMSIKRDTSAWNSNVSAPALKSGAVRVAAPSPSSAAYAARRLRKHASRLVSLRVTHAIDCNHAIVFHRHRPSSLVVVVNSSHAPSHHPRGVDPSKHLHRLAVPRRRRRRPRRTSSAPIGEAQHGHDRHERERA